MIAVITGVVMEWQTVSVNDIWLCSGYDVMKAIINHPFDDLGMVKLPHTHTYIYIHI